MGYCIRKGVKIPFDIKKPMCTEALKSWNKYKDENYPEKYCHFTGEVSNKKTSFKNPILRKNWNLAKKKYNL